MSVADVKLSSSCKWRMKPSIALIRLNIPIKLAGGKAKEQYSTNCSIEELCTDLLQLPRKRPPTGILSSHVSNNERETEQQNPLPYRFCSLGPFP